jgi:segregation and condensation protein B
MASRAEKRVADDDAEVASVQVDSAQVDAVDVEAVVVEEAVIVEDANVIEDADVVEEAVAVAEHAVVEPIAVDAVPEQPAEVEARPDELRLLEALLFAASEPLDQAALAKRMPDGVDIKAALARLQADYSLRGVNLVRVANKWTFRTAGDLSWLMTRETTETRKLSRAAIEVLAIIAYHQPVTRAEIEDIRGVVTSKGTLDVLLETGWIRPRGRRKTPGRPLTFGTTESFLSQFSLEALGDLPGLEELKGTGLLDSRLPSGFSVPNPSDDPALRDDEDPLEVDELQLMLSPAAELEFESPGAATPQAVESVDVVAFETESVEIEVEASEAEPGLTLEDLEAEDLEDSEALDVEQAEAELDEPETLEAEVSAEDVAAADETEAEATDSGDAEPDAGEGDDAKPEKDRES